MPPHIHTRYVCLCAALATLTAATTSKALDPNLPPGGNFDLSNWYLGLPVDDQGGTSGNSESISTTALVNGYSNALYFYTDTDGSMVCWAPVNGATTPGSSFPRSELRELISPPSTLINWSGYGTHILTAQCKVTEVPSTEKVIIGQIHSKTGEARPLVKLQYESGEVFALIKNSPTADPDTKLSVANVGLNNTCDYTIQMVDGLVTVTVNGASVQMDAFASDPDWANQEFYFKAGSYCQDNTGNSSEGSRVAFYQLTASHPSTNPPPTMMVTNAIVDDSFADGNRANTGPLQADWWSSSSTSGNSIEAYTGQLGLVSGTSGRGIHGTFTPQTLEIWESLIATLTFTTPATVGGPGTTSFKVAMMDFNDPGLAADLSSSSGGVNPLYTNLPGYLAGMDVGTGTEDIDFREHNVPNTIGRFLGTTTEWTSMGDGPNDGYTFSPLTQYVLEYTVTRTGADSLQLTFTLSDSGGVLSSHTAADSGGIANNFGMLGVWVNSNMFGSTNAKGELLDNGITFSNIKVDLVTEATPEPPILSISRAGNNVVLSWPTNGTAGFELEFSTIASAPVWSAAGSATAIGNSYHVTNSTTGNAKYYRLASE